MLYARNWIIACFSLVLVVVLAGCVPAVPSEPSEAPIDTSQYADRYSDELLTWAAEIRDAYAGTTLNMLGFAHPTLNAMKAITAEWEDLTGITVVYDETDLAKVRDKFVLDITSGANSYDLVMTAEVQAPEYWNLGYLEPLDAWLNDEMEVETEAWLDWDDLHPGYTMMFTSVHDGSRYAVPISGEVALLFYRTDIFDELGLAVPATYDEMLETAKFINDQGIVEDGRTVHGISFRGRPALGGGNWIWSIIVFPFGGQIVDLDDQVTPAVLAKKEGAVAAIAWETEIAKHGVPGIASFDPFDAINQYKQGFAAMSIEASVLSPGVLNPDESIVTELTGFAPLPAGPNGSFNQTFAHGVAITASSGNKGAAYAFMQWMLGRANQDLLLENGGAPVRRSAMENPANQEKWPYIEATLLGSMVWTVLSRFSAAFLGLVAHPA